MRFLSLLKNCLKNLTLFVIMAAILFQLRRHGRKAGAGERPVGDAFHWGDATPLVGSRHLESGRHWSAGTRNQVYYQMYSTSHKFSFHNMIRYSQISWSEVPDALAVN